MRLRVMPLACPYQHGNGARQDVMSQVAGRGASGRLRRERRVGLLFARVTGMIGSGWLFGACHVSKIAGPLAIWSRVGAVIMLLVLPRIQPGLRRFGLPAAGLPALAAFVCSYRLIHWGGFRTDSFQFGLGAVAMMRRMETMSWRDRREGFVVVVRRAVLRRRGGRFHAEVRLSVVGVGLRGP